MSTPPFADIKAWPPTRYTPPLSSDFPSAYDPLQDVFRMVWRSAFGHAFDDWQEDMLRATLELYPAGHERAGQLRWRQVVISLSRQNGKTEIAAALGLFMLIRRVGALVIGIASSAEQARLVYDRTMGAILRNPSLAKRFSGLTDTRGIRAASGGRYEIRAAKSAALQGLPIDLGLVDELHLLKLALWTDLVNGTGGRPDCLVVGITTAGDEGSELLIHLYGLGELAILDGDTSRLGFFVWESPSDTIPEDDDELGRHLAAASPAIACGRIDLANVIADVRGMPVPDVVRYRFNRFIAASAAFLPFEDWIRCQRGEAEAFPSGNVVFTFDRTPEWSYGSVTATLKDENGIFWSELVASIVNPNVEQFMNIALRLNSHAPRMFAMDGYALNDLAYRLRQRGLPVHVGSRADALNSAAVLFAKVKQHKLRHAGDPLLTRQIPHTIRKNSGEAFRISRQNSSVEIDGVLATALGVHVAEITPDVPMQVF